MQDDRIPGSELTPIEPDHQLPERSGRGVLLPGDDPHTVRSEIEQTRARMSRTIDELEEALVRKKERLEERLDVAAPVRERVRSAPLLYAGGVFAAALAAGYLSGDHDDEPSAERPAREADGERPQRRGKKENRWETRARELEETCVRQEEEIRALRASLAGASDVEEELEAPQGTPEAFFDRDEHDLDDREAGRSRRSPALMGLVGAGLTAVVAGAVTRLLSGRRDGEELEVVAPWFGTTLVSSWTERT